MLLDDFCNDSDGWGPINEDNNDLTPCAQTWLVFLPINLIFIIIGIISLFRAKSRIQSSNINGVDHISFYQIQNFDFIVSTAFTFAFFIGLILCLSIPNDILNWVIFTFAVQLLSWSLFTCLLYIERKCICLSGIGTAPSSFVRWYWVSQFLLCLKHFQSILVAKYVNETQELNAEFYIGTVAVIPFFLLFARAMTLKTQQSVEDKLQNIYISSKSQYCIYPKTVEENASLFDMLTFRWITAMFHVGYERRLEMSDLKYLRGADHTQQTLRLFYKAWRTQLRKTRRRNKKKLELRQRRIDRINDHRIEFTDTSSYPSSIMPTHKQFDDEKYYTPRLSKALLAAFGSHFLIIVPLVAVFTALQFAGPLILMQYLKVAQKFDDGSKDTIDEAYVYAALLFASYMLSTLLYPQFAHICMRCGMRVRSALMAACYEKTLKLTQSARSQQTAGQLLNIITVDVREIRDSFPLLLSVMMNPVTIVVALYLLYQQIGSSVFWGILSQIVMMPLLLCVGIKARRTGDKLKIERDQRMKVINEVFGCMKMVKMYSWEPLFNRKISAIRNEELRLLKILVKCFAFFIANFSWSGNLICVVSFAFYTQVYGHQLTTDKAFTSIALFNLLSFPLGQIPATIVGLINANISMRRIRKFLSANEINPNIVEYAHKQWKSLSRPMLIDDEEEERINNVISLKNVQFSWDDKGHQMALFNITVDFKANSLTMIIGETGAGKSALLRGILGNLTKIRGHVIYNDHIQIAYSSQVAWIQNETIRNNILFGEKYEKTFYDAVVHACALEDDLQMFADGDHTEIGEKGITLSGGQKQRISLARAVYSSAHVYIFDDPLSAVDSEVANHIFNECLIGLLKHKTIILATHAVSFLKYADNVLVMEQGRIALQGQLEDLVEAKVNLTKFILHKEAGSEIACDDEKTSAKIYSSPTLKAEANKAGDLHHLIEEEAREAGMVSDAVYWLYVKAAGGVGLFWLYASFMTLSAAVTVFASFWLAFWSSNEADKTRYYRRKPEWWYLKIYGLIQLIILVLIICTAIMTLVIQMNASKYLHQKLISKILRAPMCFFDTTPIGRIINRFSRDMNAVDMAVPASFYLTLRIGISLIFVVLAVCVVTPYFFAILIPLGFGYYYLQEYYIRACRELRRLSTLQNSPILSHFSDSIAGVDIIRAFGKTDSFVTKTKHLIDCDHAAYYPSFAGSWWLSVRLQFIGNCLIGFAALCCAILKPSAGYVGVSLSTIMVVGYALALFVKQKARLEQDIVSVERIYQYSNKNAVEEKAYISAENRPNKSWPQHGSISFNNVFMKYRPELDYVFAGITFNIFGGEKVGVIGRTGAGKSSLFVCLLRIVEIEQNGTMVIDNVDIANIGLRDLRQRISVIAQDPVLFTGTVRFNLDPFQEKSDDELIEALQLSHCYEAFKKMVIAISIKKDKEKEEEKERERNDENKTAKESLLNANFSDEKYYDLNPLDIEVEENGSNFSVGQRQLLCLARAIVRKSKILLFDEPTSAVDPYTDQLIQETIRKIFQKNTILTIAHRIDTILDYDRILIIDNGKVLEFDSPDNLLANKDSKFVDIVKASFGVNLETVLKRDI